MVQYAGGSICPLYNKVSTDRTAYMDRGQQVQLVPPQRVLVRYRHIRPGYVLPVVYGARASCSSALLLAISLLIG